MRKLAVLFVPKAPEFNCAPVRAKGSQSVPCIVIKLVRALAKNFVLLNGPPSPEHLFGHPALYSKIRERKERKGCTLLVWYFQSMSGSLTNFKEKRENTTPPTV